eukprot:TRINITY_DN1995_c0_g1_i3.p1 TRINITY_DN1995_c0_g1~~TRINITY_DN1995_c0_g1_i3.p1  ORF type:complete len:218 (-),score=36.30 TRINITY_DN1995_c0_g1_i3:102-755(-)
MLLKTILKGKRESVFKRKIDLPPIPPHLKKTLILDLDETLIRSSKPCLGKTHIEKTHSINNVPILFRDSYGEAIEIDLSIRPYANYLLEQASKKYQIIVFSASLKSYANAISMVLDPEKKYISYTLSREHCKKINGIYMKDLNLLAGRDLKDVAILDNSVLSFALNLENGIYLPSYEGDANDNELISITHFLMEIADEDDLRPHIVAATGIKRALQS